MDLFAHGPPIWIIALGLFVAMAAAWELGVRLHRRVSRRPAEARGDGSAQVLTAVMGLLALLVAFTFGLALSRYEARRDLVVQEANALGTAYLRTAQLERPGRLRELLRLYARERLAYGLTEGRQQAQAQARAAQLQGAVWAEANVQLPRDRPSVITNLVLAPLNQAFDLASARTALMAARIPLTVLVVLWVYAVVTGLVLGYVIGGGRGASRNPSLVMFALLALALGLILDLDRPRGGTIRVPQTPMSDVLSAMG